MDVYSFCIFFNKYIMNFNFFIFFIISIKLIYKVYCFEGYYGLYCNIYCFGNIIKCVRNGYMYCKMGKIVNI